MKNLIPTIVFYTFFSIFFSSCSQPKKNPDDISLSELRQLNNPCEYLNAFFTLYDAAYQIYYEEEDKEYSVLVQKELLRIKLELCRNLLYGGVIKYNDSTVISFYEKFNYSKVPFIKNHKEQFLAGVKSILNNFRKNKFTDQQFDNIIEATEDSISEINKREDISPENKERWKKIRKKHEDIMEIIFTKYTRGELEECEKWDTIKQVAGRQWYRDFWKLLP
jgi:hypothetical protein